MKLSDIVAITGKPGLYKILSKTRNGIVVESMDEQKRKFPVHSNFQVATLDEITIYSNDAEELYLRDVLLNMDKHEEEKPDAKADNKVLREYFREVAPTHDEERVYQSDIKKVIKWHGILKERNVDYTTEEKPDENESKDNE